MHTAEAMNPWISIWTKPRDTIRHLIDTNPRRMVLALAAIGGGVQLLDRAALRSIGDDLSTSLILGMAVTLGPVFGILTLYVGSLLIGWTGNWLGGRAPAAHIRTAMAWASVPIAASLLLWIADLTIVGEEMFTTSTPKIDANAGVAGWVLLSGVGAMVLGVWSLVLLFKGIGEAQGFSAWKGLGNVLLSILVVLVPIVLLGIAAAVLMPRAA